MIPTYRVTTITTNRFALSISSFPLNLHEQQNFLKDKLASSLKALMKRIV